MNFLWDKITEWLKNLLIGGIMNNLSGLFDGVNQKVSEVAGTVGATPQDWNASVFNMVKSLSENVVVPIAGIILTFIMTYELIQMIIDKNSFHDFETFMFFKWVFKTFAAVLIVTNTWNIIMGIFDVAQHVVNQAAGVIVTEASLDIFSVAANMEASLRNMDIGPLLGLWFQTQMVGMIAWILSVCIFIIVYAMKLPDVRMKWDRFLIKGPAFGKLVVKIYTARFAQTMASLYSSGLHSPISALSRSLKTSLK